MAYEGDRMAIEGSNGVVEAEDASDWDSRVMGWKIGEQREKGEDFVIGFLL